MNPTATEYRNSADSFPEFRTKILLRSTAFILISLVFSIIIFFYSGDEDFAGSITIPIIYFLFILGILVFAIMRVLKQQEAIYLSYKLTITDDGIYREQSNLPTVTINLKDITEINENVSGHIIIKEAMRAR